MSSVLLMSGGLDSTALLYWLRPELAITVDYGQLAALGEIRASKRICAKLGVRHKVVSANCRAIGAGIMSGNPASEFAVKAEWWPFRNQLLVTLACMLCIDLGVDRVLIGSVRTDAEYMDGRKEFVEKLDALVSSQDGGIRVEAPAIGMTTEELIKSSGVPPPILALSHSCLRSEYGCGECRGCMKFNRILTQMSISDGVVER